jgi:peptidoglycan/xylan/chitin deacetylase (PgdA/CDA1 family)
MGAGLAVFAAGCDGGKPVRQALGTGRESVSTPAVTAQTAPPTTTSTTITHAQAGARANSAGIPAARPGPPRVVYQAAGPTNKIALTIDDGYCAPCAEAYAQFAAGTGIHITFSPNGMYQPIWNPLARILDPLIRAGQVQIANHTYHHVNLVASSNGRIEHEIERNEEWIQKTFGITARPWMRPPYGARSARTDEVAAGLGYRNILMWNGSFGDSELITQTELLTLARKWLRPGAIMLGHANHTTVTHVFSQIQAIIASRGLQPVTLDEMFGTSRALG